MEQENKMQFMASRIVFGAFIASVAAFAGAVEYVNQNEGIKSGLKPLLDGRAMAALKYALLAFAALALWFGVSLKKAVSTLEEGVFLSVAKAITKNAHRMGGTAYGILLTIGAICEAAGIMGVLLYFLSGGRERLFPYFFIAPALLALVIMFPKDEDGENLESIDNSVKNAAVKNREAQQ